MITFEAASEQDLNGLAPQILSAFGDNKMVLFYGEMGAGKTTLIKALCQALGVDDTTSSPTFSIVNEYLGNSGERIYHFDFYRIDDEEEVMDLGYEDYFYSGDYCFIEWPEKIPNLLPEDPVKVSIEVAEHQKRRISVAR
ncbi:MAG: tRNA (adenosine(37)-N6)-threonylcarbamoyltransferase complex ATPase subunit type 1 TsaE [Flavobacteriales bacterium]|nr:tRNA (adenosine(37)-N6)-threonylcarbamoyltransferase complex ATPase subunit type 1 TsaE [Flavobacteriales bacterium]